MFFKDIPFFWVILSAHLLGDFYFQSGRMAEEKREKLSVLLLHCLIYGGTVLAVACALCGWTAAPAAAAAALGHLAVDWLKFEMLKDWPDSPPGRVLLIDQAVHLVILAVIALWRPAAILPWVPELLTALGCVCGLSTLLRLCCLCLFLGKPANIFLKACNRKPEAGEEGEEGEETVPQAGDRRAGAVIGVMERLLTAVLFLLGQYGAISVIFAAKSLTRFKRIEESPEFGEYYLVGTLGSLLAAILATVFLFPPAIPG